MNFADSLIQAVPGGVVHVLIDGSVRLANPEALRILGLKFDELTKMYIIDFETETLLEDGTPCPAAEYPVAKVLGTGQPQGPLTIGVRRPDGTVCWAVFKAQPVYENGKLEGALVTFFDVTSRKEVEDALRQSEARWRGLSEHSPDFVLTVDRNLIVQTINRSNEDETPHYIIGTDLLSYVEPGFLPEWKRQAARVFESKQPVRFDARGGAGGAVQWFETYLVPLLDKDDEITRLLVVARDITERQSMLSSIAEKDRLANVGMLASSVAHEIMNPLTYVLAHLDYALKMDGEKRDKAIAAAREGAMRMQQIVYDLRSLGRTGQEELFYVDVGSVLETALRLCGPEIGRRASVKLALGEIPGVLASESRLCQVFMNLLVNAAQAGDGELTIRVSTRLEGDFVGIEFADDGEGIAPESMSRLFEPFFTTKKQGTGLGLSISRDVVQRMGGHIDVESKVGEGTVFTVWLSTTREARRSEPRAGHVDQ